MLIVNDEATKGRVFITLKDLKIGLHQSVCFESRKIPPRESPRKLNRFFIVFTTASDNENLTLRTAKRSYRIDDPFPHLERQRLDRIDLENKIESTEPLNWRLEKISNVETDVRFGVDAFRPFDRRR